MTGGGIMSHTSQCCDRWWMPSWLLSAECLVEPRLYMTLHGFHLNQPKLEYMKHSKIERSLPLSGLSLWTVAWCLLNLYPYFTVIARQNDLNKAIPCQDLSCSESFSSRTTTNCAGGIWKFSTTIRRPATVWAYMNSCLANSRICWFRCSEAT